MISSVLSDYPKRFINRVIRHFQDNENQYNIDDFDDYIILPNFSDMPKSFILIELPFCKNNEIKWKYFLKKFYIILLKTILKELLNGKLDKSKLYFLLKRKYSSILCDL